MTSRLQSIAALVQPAAARAGAWAIERVGNADLWVGAVGLLIMLVTLWLVIRDAANGPRAPRS